MAEENSLKRDLQKAVKLLKQQRLEEAGHQLKDVSIKAYYSSRNSSLEQHWLNLHKITCEIGHVLLRKDQTTTRQIEQHRRESLDILEDLLNGELEEFPSKSHQDSDFVFTEEDHIAALKDEILFLEKELEKSQKQVLELRKERRSQT